MLRAWISLDQLGSAAYRPIGFCLFLAVCKGVVVVSVDGGQEPHQVTIFTRSAPPISGDWCSPGGCGCLGSVLTKGVKTQKPAKTMKTHIDKEEVGRFFHVFSARFCCLDNLDTSLGSQLLRGWYHSWSTATQELAVRCFFHGKVDPVPWNITGFINDMHGVNVCQYVSIGVQHPMHSIAFHCIPASHTMGEFGLATKMLPSKNQWLA